MEPKAVIDPKDRKEIFEQYEIGYAYTVAQVMRWYNVSRAAAVAVLKEARRKAPPTNIIEI